VTPCACPRVDGRLDTPGRRHLSGCPLHACKKGSSYPYATRTERGYSEGRPQVRVPAAVARVVERARRNPEDEAALVAAVEAFERERWG